MAGIGAASQKHIGDLLEMHEKNMVASADIQRRKKLADDAFARRFDEVLKTRVRGDHRRGRQRHLRQLAEQGEVEFTVARTPDELVRDLPAAFELMERRRAGLPDDSGFTTAEVMTRDDLSSEEARKSGRSPAMPVSTTATPTPRPVPR